MGYINDRVAIERAARYLMVLLNTETAVRYSRFYDGTAETARSLNRHLGLDEDAWPPEHGLMNFAVCELEDAGLVILEELPSILMDGDSNYEVRLSDAGRAFLKQDGLFTITVRMPQSAELARPFEEALQALRELQGRE